MRGLAWDVMNYGFCIDARDEVGLVGTSLKTR